MKACIASLRAEIAELRTAFQEVEAAVSAKDSEAWSVGGAHLHGGLVLGAPRSSEEGQAVE